MQSIDGLFLPHCAIALAFIQMTTTPPARPGFARVGAPGLASNRNVLYSF